MRLSLGGAWTVRAVAPGPEVPAEIRDRVFAAVVPGCIHTDLLADGAIDDPFDGNNESRYAWIGRTAWRYERTFRWSSGSAVSGRAQHTELVTEGLDTVASIELNGLPIARTANQHRTYRFDIGAELVTGENT
ncbi:MAG: beta-mannosidase, partial [Subtercola sp.]|nr:beta-mannosidase [Subtercola sp.]